MWQTAKSKHNKEKTQRKGANRKLPHFVSVSTEVDAVDKKLGLATSDDVTSCRQSPVSKPQATPTYVLIQALDQGLGWTLERFLQGRILQ